MMVTYPTYAVSASVMVDGAPRGVSFRVSENELRSFLNVLVFNGVPEFSVRREVRAERQVRAERPDEDLLT